MRNSRIQLGWTGDFSARSTSTGHGCFVPPEASCPRPRSVCVFWSEKSPIVPQLLCPVRWVKSLFLTGGFKPPQQRLFGFDCQEDGEANANRQQPVTGRYRR